MGNIPTITSQLVYNANHRFWMIRANNHLFTVDNGNSRKRFKHIQSHWCHSGVFNVNFEHISHLFLLFMLLTLSTYLFAGIGKWLWLTINLLIPVMGEKIPRSTWIQIYPLKVLPPYYRNHSTNFHFEFNHWFLYKGNNAFKKLSREENAVILL